MGTCSHNNVTKSKLISKYKKNRDQRNTKYSYIINKLTELGIKCPLGEVYSFTTFYFFDALKFLINFFPCTNYCFRKCTFD